MATIQSGFISQAEYEEPTSDVPSRHRMTALAGAAGDTILDEEVQARAEKDDERNRPERPPGLLLGVAGLYILYRLFG